MFHYQTFAACGRGLACRGCRRMSSAAVVCIKQPKIAEISLIRSWTVAICRMRAVGNTGRDLFRADAFGILSPTPLVIEGIRFRVRKPKKVSVSASRNAFQNSLGY